MKFSTKKWLAIERGERECYLSLIRRAKPWDVNVLIANKDMMDVPGKQGHKHKNIEMVDTYEEVFILDEIDPV